MGELSEMMFLNQSCSTQRIDTITGSHLMLVRRAGGRGRGVFVKSRNISEPVFKEGSCVFSERPADFEQLLFSR